MRKINQITRIIISVFIIYILVMVGITAYLYETYFGYRGSSSEKLFENYPSLVREKVEILSNNGTKLTGYFYNTVSKTSEKKALLVFSHGIGGTHSDYLHEIEYFAKKGYKVFAFDNTGSGESDGETISGLSQSVVDLDYVLKYLKKSEKTENLPIFLYGHSWGGFAVCAVNNYNHNISAIAERSGFNKASDIIYHKICDTLNPTYGNLLRPYISIYEFLKFGKYSLKSATDGINKANCPVLIMHSLDDTIVPYNDSIVASKDKIKNTKTVIKTFSNKSHFITSTLRNNTVVGSDIKTLDLILDFYNNAL